ncbi:MAG: hypothetical protein MJ003_04840 [Paludibacteraceae bacterium]|nr:hypothetical protein [Paludibacteraceae bacterium]
MEKVFEEILNYLSNASEEQLKKDWEEFKDLNDEGPLMGKLIEESIVCIQTNAIIAKETSVNYKNPYYTEPNNSMAA